MADKKECSLRKLHPTQLTLGMLEVRDKTRELEKLAPDQRTHFMQSHPNPAVIGPEGTLFLIDHHHLCRAALAVGIDKGFVEVEANLSSHGAERFWEDMDERGWVHPLDENGVRHRYPAIPRRLEDLVDDVYRSLATSAPREATRRRAPPSPSSSGRTSSAGSSPSRTSGPTSLRRRRVG